ncbi:MAG TPA: DUF1326 domain-containing protein [Burkholderiales bacterium]|nr:DUF1326 domain-containing protein [Burkholderiales bacterium]
MTDIPQWDVAGNWFDVCKCNIPCPCTFAQAPTYGDCEGILAYHVTQGHFGDVRLDGLNLILIGAFEGDLWAGKAKNVKFAIFMDMRADERQRAALQTIFSGQGGGVPGQLFGIWGRPEVVGFEVAPIEFEVAEDLAHWRASVPGKLTAAAQALSGPTSRPGDRVQLHNPPGSEVGPGAVATWGRATADRANAFGFNFDWAGRSSKHIAFDWSGPA